MLELTRKNFRKIPQPYNSLKPYALLRQYGFISMLNLRTAIFILFCDNNPISHA
jgi:hypothetical protein